MAGVWGIGTARRGEGHGLAYCMVKEITTHHYGEIYFQYVICDQASFHENGRVYKYVLWTSFTALWMLRSL